MDNHKYLAVIDHGLFHNRAYFINHLQQPRSKLRKIKFYKDRRRLTSPGAFNGQFKQKAGLRK